MKFFKWLGYDNAFMTYVWLIWFLVTIIIAAPFLVAVIKVLVSKAN